MASASIPSDPWNQSITLYTAQGGSFNITITDLDDFASESVNACINYGAQLGASLALLVVVLLLTKADKRKSPIFILNTTSLALSFIRSLLQCLYYTSGFSEIYAYFSQDYTRVGRSDYATSIAADVLTLLLLISIQCSLVLQTQVTTTTLARVYRILLLVSSAIMSLLAVGFRLSLSVVNAQAILSAAAFNNYAWLVSATNITTTISICFFCIVFASKLGYSLHQRRKLGLRQFGPMQVIFIMGCQTMIIPATFAILQYIVHSQYLSPYVLTLVAILLPLSSVWAASAMPSSNTTTPSDMLQDSQRRLFGSTVAGSTLRSSTFASVGYKGSKNDSSALSPTTITSMSTNDSTAGKAKVSLEGEDLEAQDGVRINRTFGVRSSKA